MAHKIIGALMMPAANCPPASETDSQLKKTWKRITMSILPPVLLYSQVNTTDAKTIETANIGKPIKPNST